MCPSPTFYMSSMYAGSVGKVFRCDNGYGFTGLTVETKLLFFSSTTASLCRHRPKDVVSGANAITLNQDTDIDTQIDLPGFVSGASQTAKVALRACPYAVHQSNSRACGSRTGCWIKHDSTIQLTWLRSTKTPSSKLLVFRTHSFRGLGPPATANGSATSTPTILCKGRIARVAQPLSADRSISQCCRAARSCMQLPAF